MAVLRERPYAGSNFLVDFGTADPRSASAGFCEVIFPKFAVEAEQVQAIGSDESSPSRHLVLKRGVFGSTDLYHWFDKARRGKAPQRRTLKVALLNDDSSEVVLTWRFRNVRPVSLSYSPLRAMEAGLLIETLELAFDSMELV